MVKYIKGMTQRNRTIPLSTEGGRYATKTTNAFYR